jgi:hypothetical protein
LTAYSLTLKLGKLVIELLRIILGIIISRTVSKIERWEAVVSTKSIILEFGFFVIGGNIGDRRP